MLAIVCPGQGSQTPGFLQPWLELPLFRERLEVLAEASGLDLAAHGTTSDASTITDTAVAQPLIVASGLAAVPALLGQAPETAARVGLAAGHSVGEITAAAFAGVLGDVDAMAFIGERGRGMAAASAAAATGMSAVLGGDATEVAQVLQRHGLTAANANGGGQVVAAGTLEQLSALSADPPARARVIPLKVAGAFHTEHMAPAVDGLRRLAEGMSPRDPRVPLVSNADGAVVRDGAEVLRRLVAQVSSPVRWDLCMETLGRLGVTGLIELPPAGTLVGLAKRGLKGVGAYRPERVVPNSEVIDKIDSSDEWIRERSGIISRRFAAKDESVIDMSERASREALQNAGLDAAEIDAVIVSTVTHPYQTPAAAPMLADRFGIRGAAFDIGAACAGYCHAVAIANDLVRGGSAQHVLVVGVEKLSDFTDPYDRSTAFIFGDGAGAAVIGPSDTPAIGPTVWGSDGSQWQTISQRDSWIELRESGGVGTPAIGMAGQSVFRWAVWGMAPVAQKALDAAGVRADDLDAFIPHQANMRIIDAMIKQLKLPADIPVARDIAETANTSAASIPLATERMLREGEAPHGGLALQIGFGAGLVYAAQVIVLP